MSPDEFRQVLDALSLTQVRLSVFLGLDERTVRRWALGERPVPRSVVLLLRLMVRDGLTPEHLESL